MTITEHFRKRTPDGKLKPGGVYIHVEGGLEIRIKAFAEDAHGKRYVIIQSRNASTKPLTHWNDTKDINLYVSDSVSYSFDYIPD